MWRLVLVGVLVAVGLPACGSSSTSDPTLRAVAAFYPLQWVTEQVAGPGWTITGLTRPGAEPHDLEIGIRQTAEVDRADMVVYQRGLQPAVDETVDNIATGRTLDAAHEVHLRPFVDHAEEHQDHAEEHQDHDHTDDDLDPHFWLDPLLMADLAEAVAADLAVVDPAHESTYAERAAHLRGQLTGIDEEYSRGLSACERDTVVVTHDAFGYLGRYGLHFESIVGLSPDAEPTPAVLGRLQELIVGHGLTTVFTERLASPAMAESLAEDAGVSTAVLDPIEGPGEDATSSDYLSLMRENLAALQEANEC